MNDSEIRAMLTAALETAAPDRKPALDTDGPVESLGLDSLALTEMIFYIEDRLGRPLPDALLNELSSVTTVFGLTDAFRRHLTSQPA